MKFAVNHPHKFKGYNKDRNGNQVEPRVSKVIAPFFMGFIQTLIAIVIEILVCIQLSEKTDFWVIIIQFASLAIIVTFDDRYAAALHKHKIN